MKNVMNDLYARDTSEKIRSARLAVTHTGKYIGSYAPYGYQKSPEDKYKLVLDPVTAPVVRQIFDLRCQGRSYRNIALTLNDHGIPTPRDYYYQCKGQPNPRNETPFWTGKTVDLILRNEVYIGNTVQNRTGSLSYKVHKQIDKPEAEWVRVEHTHEPIVSVEAWELARHLAEESRRTRTMKDGKTALFSGLLFCADCGCPMRHDHESRKMKNGQPSTYESYLCTRYSNSGRGACSSHSIGQKVLIQIVQTDIKNKAECASRDPERLKEIIRSKQHAASQEQRKTLHTQLTQTEQRLVDLDRLIPSTYEDKALGRIPESLCIQLMNQYETERQNKLVLRAELSAKLEESQQADNGAEDWISMMREYDSLETLDRATLLRLIDRIEVGERRIVDGEQQREIRIRHKFVGEIDV